MCRVAFSRLTKRTVTTILGVLAMGCVAAWLLLLNFFRDRAREEAVALYDRLQPRMTADEFNQVTKDEPITAHERTIIAEPFEIPGGTRSIIWTHAGRFEFIVYFGGNGLVRKVITEEGWGEESRYSRYAESYFGIPAPRVYKY
jgi:hypothetical protein